MYRLLLDSSDINLLVGISKDDKVVYRHFEYAWQRQSEYMIPEIEKALLNVGITLKDIDEVVVGIGPGSYTGVRIALTIGKTISLAKKIPIIEMSSLNAIAGAKGRKMSIIDARSKRCNVGF